MLKKGKIIQSFVTIILLFGLLYPSASFADVSEGVGLDQPIARVALCLLNIQS
jgi:hypothetical protein